MHVYDTPACNYSNNSCMFITRKLFDKVNVNVLIIVYGKKIIINGFMICTYIIITNGSRNMTIKYQDFFVNRYIDYTRKPSCSRIALWIPFHFRGERQLRLETLNITVITTIGQYNIRTPQPLFIQSRA